MTPEEKKQAASALRNLLELNDADVDVGTLIDSHRSLIEKLIEYLD